MRDRGESLREIARMAGIGEKTARELIRSTDKGAAAGEGRAVNGSTEPPLGGPAAAAEGAAGSPHLRVSTGQAQQYA
jgi:hypothetical protein